MRKFVYILVFINITSFCYSQNIFKEYKGKKQEYLVNFVFKNCQIKYNKTKDISVFGQKKIFEHFKIKSRIPIQTKKSYDETKNKYANRKIKFGLNFRQDSSYIFFDTIHKIIQKEISNKGVSNTKSNQTTDDYDGVSCGVFLANNNYILYVRSLNKITEPYYILWFNNKIFYLEITGRKKGFGSISSFIMNSISLKTNTNNNINNGCKLVTVESISMINQILNELKLKYARK